MNSQYRIATGCRRRMRHRDIGVAITTSLTTWLACRLLGVAVFPAGLLIPVLVVSTMTDIRTREIPNWLTLPGIAFAISAAAIVSAFGHRFTATTLAAPTLVESLMGFAATFGMMLLLWSLGAVGAGDVKLAGLIGACVGTASGLNALLISHIAAGAFAIAYLFMRLGPAMPVRLMWAWRQSAEPGNTSRCTNDHGQLLSHSVPMAGWLLLGTMLTLFEVRLI